MKGLPLIASGLVHLGLMLALMRGTPSPSSAPVAHSALIMFEPIAPLSPAPLPAEPSAEAPPPDPLPAPAPDPQPSAAPEPSPAQPQARPTPAPSAPAPASAPAPDPSPAPQGPRRLDLTLSNGPGDGGSAGTGGAGSTKGTAGGRGTGTGALAAAPKPPACEEARTKPKPLSRVTIEYPAAARAAGVEGRVVLRAIIDARGEVREVIIVESADPEIDGPAAAALARWRFEPATRCGAAVEAPYVIAREFRLGD